MKKISILLTIIFLFFNCSQSKKQDRSGLVTLVLNNWTNGTATDQYTNGSLVIFTKVDLANLTYNGQCLDTFTLYGIKASPSNYYRTVPGGAGGSLNTNIKKYALSTSSCSSLGFASSSVHTLGSSSQRPNPDMGFTFKMYSCDPNNNPCPSKGITAAGF